MAALKILTEKKIQKRKKKTKKLEEKNYKKLVAVTINMNKGPGQSCLISKTGILEQSNDVRNYHARDSFFFYLSNQKLSPKLLKTEVKVA